VPLDCQSCGTKIRLVGQLPRWFKWACIGIGFPLALVIGVRNPFVIFAVMLVVAGIGGGLYAVCVPPKVEVYHAWSGVPTSLIVPKEPLE
jgi:hypothetical protein